MKHPKSKLLTDCVAEARKADRVGDRLTREDRAWLAKFEAGYPYNQHEAVFSWLWVNHAEVAELRRNIFGRTWHGIAVIMQEEGVKGSRGEPPNANSVRRVWGRVCKDVEKRAAQKAAEKGK